MSTPESPAGQPGIPLPIVTLNRWTIVVTIVLALILQQPWITTALLIVLLGSVVFGPPGSLIFQLGRRVLSGPVSRAKERGEVEDRRLMRFNNTIAVIFLALAQIAFLLDATIVGWALALVVVIAASVALAGFCVGCFIFYRFRLAQYRWANLGSR